MQISQHKPMLSKGSAYLNHFKQFDQVSKELDNTSADGYRPGGNMESLADTGSLNGEFIASFRGDNKSTTVDRYKSKDGKNEILGVTDETVGGEGKLGSYVGRSYSDQGDSLKVHERFQTLTDVDGNGTTSLSTFTVDKQSGAIAMFEGSPLEQSGFVYS